VREGLANVDFGQERTLLELLIDRVTVIDRVVVICCLVVTIPDGEREPFWPLRSDY
jgi:hypothetical protein